MKIDRGEICQGSLAGTPIARLAGELDLMAVPEVRDHLHAALASRPELYVLDLRNLAYLDSAGVGLLLGVHQRVREYGGTLVLLGLQAAVERVLRISGLDEVFLTCADEEELADRWRPAPAEEEAGSG